ncbi:MAG: enoyl-CoA hydratase/isomerase family protein [Proteobacteria bacterium]|nr:enoyl-CoA hydratase/isomerase family protein [Pseudomonadota bacterium]
MATVLFEQVTPHIGKIILNDPESLNAMSEGMATEFRELVARLKSAATLPRALILTGAGRAFSAGGDLAMLKQKTTLSKQQNQERMLWFYDSFLSVLDLEVPLIAAINGHAIGAGLCVASACDIRLVATGAKLGFTFVKLGLHPGMGATYMLPQVLGSAAARELLLTGRVVEAEEALCLGLVSKVVAPEMLPSEAHKVAEEIAANGPLCIRQLLRSVRSPALTLQSALQREALCQADNYAGAEFLEGVQATMEKRKPNF